MNYLHFFSLFSGDCASVQYVLSNHCWNVYQKRHCNVVMHVFILDLCYFMTEIIWLKFIEHLYQELWVIQYTHTYVSCEYNSPHVYNCPSITVSITPPLLLFLISQSVVKCILCMWHTMWHQSWWISKVLFSDKHIAGSQGDPKLCLEGTSDDEDEASKTWYMH